MVGNQTKMTRFKLFFLLDSVVSHTCEPWMFEHNMPPMEGPT
jgi:hypothetical protein